MNRSSCVPVTNMASTRNIFIALLLCLSVFYSEGWLIKRQDFADCGSRTDSCIQNTRVIVGILNIGDTENLVVDGQFAMQCSAEARENSARCVQDNADCLQMYEPMGFGNIIEFMCTNEPGFVNATSCWNSGSVPDTFAQCVRDNLMNDRCAIPGCLEQDIATISGCSNQAASLFANIAQIMLSNSEGC